MGHISHRKSDTFLMAVGRTVERAGKMSFINGMSGVSFRDGMRSSYIQDKRRAPDVPHRDRYTSQMRCFRHVYPEGDHMLERLDLSAGLRTSPYLHRHAGDGDQREGGVGCST